MGPRQDVSAAGTFGEMLLQKVFTTYLGDDAGRFGSIKEFKGKDEHLFTKVDDLDK